MVSGEKNMNLKSFTIRDKKGNILIKLYQRKNKLELMILESIRNDLVITGINKENKKVYFNKHI